MFYELIVQKAIFKCGFADFSSAEVYGDFYGVLLKIMRNLWFNYRAFRMVF
jgi:hypothetical protein